MGGLYSWRGDARDQFCAICLFPRVGASKAAAAGRRRRWVHPTPGRKKDSMGQTKRVRGAEGATPNCKRQQQQDVHRDSRNNLHEAEGDRKRDRQ